MADSGRFYQTRTGEVKPAGAETPVKQMDTPWADGFAPFTLDGEPALVYSGDMADRQNRVDWAKWDDHLGTMTDKRLAAKIGCTVLAVKKRRARLGVKCFQMRPKLTPEGHLIDEWGAVWAISNWHHRENNGVREATANLVERIE